MKTYMLKDILNARYLHKVHVEPMRQFVSSIIQEGTQDDPVCIDIAGTRFTPDIASEINFLISPTVKFISTENEDDNSVLKFNYNFCITPTEYKTELPVLESSNQIMDYLKNLKGGYIYTLPQSNREAYVPIMALAILLRPRVEFDITDCTQQVIALICKDLYKKDISLFTQSWNKYKYLYKDNFIQFETDVKTDDELFYVYGLQNVNWSTLMQERYVLPSYVGEINVLSAETSELWKDVVISLVNQVSVANKHKTLCEYLKEESEDDN